MQKYLDANGTDSVTTYNIPVKKVIANKEDTVNKKEDITINKEQFKGTLMQQIKISEALDQLKIIKEDIVNLENILK